MLEERKKREKKGNIFLEICVNIPDCQATRNRCASLYIISTHFRKKIKIGSNANNDDNNNNINSKLRCKKRKTRKHNNNEAP